MSFRTPKMKENLDGIFPSTFKNYSSSCKVLIYRYGTTPTSDLGDDPKVVTKCKILEFSSGENYQSVLSYSYTKSNSNCAGYFAFTLAPDQNWLYVIQPGDWVEIYMKHDTEDYSLRVLGMIDSISMQESLNPSTYERSVAFSVSGRDFGKVLEKYSIYVNMFNQSALSQSTNIQDFIIKQIIGKNVGSPDQNVTAICQAFLGAGDSFGVWETQGQLKQFFLPEGLSAKYGGGERFIDIFSFANVQVGLPGYKQMTVPPSKNFLWRAMQGYANLHLNEMFVELDDSDLENVRPALYLRTIPFATRDFVDESGLLEGVVNYYLDLPEIKINGGEILESATRLHDHDRFSFLVMISENLENAPDTPNISVSYLAGKYPWIDKAASMRYGTTVFERSSDYYLTKDQKFEPGLLVAFNSLLKNWYEHNAYLEDMDVTIAAKPDLRIGKRITFENSYNNWGQPSGTYKTAYVESYMEQWTFGSLWTQTINATRGLFVQNGKEVLGGKIYNKDNTFNNANYSAREES